MSDPKLPTDEEVLERIKSFPKEMTMPDGTVVPMIRWGTPEWDAAQKACEK